MPKIINGPFNPSVTAEREFIRSLRKIARVSGHIVETHVDGTTIKNSPQMIKALEDYSRILTPWATRQSSRMLEQVMKSNRRAYQNKSKAIGLALKLNVAEENVGKTASALMLEQVELIKSIPLEAGKRAQQLALEGFYNGTRASDIAQELKATTSITESRAILIGRTETARANASINQVRALSVGSRQYRWHNSGDGNVRHSHLFYKGQRLQGMIFSWDAPPTLSDGMTGHPGTFPNCRCFAEAIFEDEGYFQIAA